MIGAIELVKDRESKEPFGTQDRVGQEVYKKGLRENIILRPLGNVIYFFLPLSIKKNEIKTIIKKALKIIKLYPLEF
jgi:adenosylmethionine-8-amino-7-oxononanoate aminotransferase